VNVLAVGPSRGYSSHFAGWHDLWAWSFLYAYPNADDPTVPLPAWTALILAQASAWRSRSGDAGGGQSCWAACGRGQPDLAC